MSSTWRTHTAPAIRAAVKPYRAEGWKAGPSAARYEGVDGVWAHVFLIHAPRQHYLWLGFCAGIYCPLLRELYGFRTNRSRPPHQDYWANSLMLEWGRSLHMVSTGAGHVPAPFELESGETDSERPIRMDWPDFPEWFAHAFDVVQPELVRLASNQALFEEMRRHTDNETLLRDAILLGVALGHEDQLPPLIDRAAELTDQWAAERSASDPDWRFHDRMKNPVTWSHRRFMRQVDKVPTIMAAAGG